MATIVETPRLRLRDWVLSDSERFFAIHGDARVHRFTGSEPTANVDAARARLARTIEMNATRGYGHWALVEREGEELVGNCGFRPAERDGELEIGFIIAPDRWRLGYATEIVDACARFGFDRFGLRRIVSLTDPENLAARRVLEKVAFTRVADETHDERVWAVYERLR
jgi:[ribosomal protein S5]-alanine N-acetyltransferase